MEMEPRAAAMTTIQVGDGGGWSWVEVRKVVGVAAEDWLMETLSRRMILVSNIKFAKKSSKMKTEPWPLEVGSGRLLRERREWRRKWRQSLWISERQARRQRVWGLEKGLVLLPPHSLHSLSFLTWEILGCN